MLGQSAGGRGGGLAKPAGGVQLIAKRPPGLIAPPLPESAGVTEFTLPDDAVTQRCAAGLAHILGPTVLYLLQPTSAAQPYTPPQATSTLLATATTPARAATPSPTPSLDQPVLVIASSTSTGTTTTQTSSTPSRAPTSAASVVTVTNTTTITQTPTSATVTVAQTSASASVSTRTKSVSKYRGVR